jgi:hypothetical protein
MKPSLLKDKIFKLLQDHKHLRDDDYKLIANIWHSELKVLGVQHDKALATYAQGKLTAAESITRCRRKLQEMHGNLRGEKYMQRLKEQQNVIEDLKTNF